MCVSKVRAKRSTKFAFRVLGIFNKTIRSLCFNSFMFLIGVIVGMYMISKVAYNKYQRSFYEDVHIQLQNLNTNLVTVVDNSYKILDLKRNGK